MHPIEMTPTPPNSKGLQEFLDALPVDDEPLSPEELAVHRERVAEAERGETVPHAEVAAGLAGWHKTDVVGVTILIGEDGTPKRVRLVAEATAQPHLVHPELREWGAKIVQGTARPSADGMILEHDLEPV